MQRIASYSEINAPRFEGDPKVRMDIGVIVMNMYSRFYKNKCMGKEPYFRDFKTYRLNLKYSFRTGDFVIIQELKSRNSKQITGRSMLGLLKDIKHIPYTKISLEEQKDLQYCYPEIDPKSILKEITIERCMILN